MRRRKVSAAKRALRRDLEAMNASEWDVLAGVRVAWVYGATWFELGGMWRSAPRTVAELEAALSSTLPSATDGAPQGSDDDEYEAATDGSGSGAHDLGGEHLDRREELVRELMVLYELATFARVTRTAEELEHLTLEQPRPEVIHSGQVGARGMARWQPPCVAGAMLRFFANAPRGPLADFVYVEVNLLTGQFSIEVVDGGWFEEISPLSCE